MKVKLRDIADAIDAQSVDIHCFLNTKTGELVFVTDDDFRAAEDDIPLEDLPEWQEEQIMIAKEILDDENRGGDLYIPLPDKFEFHEWEVMRDFILQLEDDEQRETLYRAIHGRGAFRRFKDLIYEFGIESQWYKYKEDVLLELARQWCERKGIAYDE